MTHPEATPPAAPPPQFDPLAAPLQLPGWLRAIVWAFALLVLGGGVLLALALQRVPDFTQVVQHPSELVLHLGSELEHDANGRTNILLFGSGGKDWDEGTDLTDTIMVASVDEAKRHVTLISIPRDLFVQLPGYGWSRLNYLWPYGVKKAPTGTKIPALPKQVVGQITGLEIHYVLKVDFSGFTRMIDALGGVELTVERAFTDTQYPTEDYRYQTVKFEAGPQTLTGEQALKFARSRHAPGPEGTDFARSHRQQQVIQAVREKLLAREVLDDPQRITELVNLVNEHYTTDLTFADDLTLARVAKSVGRDGISSLVIDDSPPDPLVMEPSPEERMKTYGGAFVMVPVDPTYQTIHRRIGEVLDHPELLVDPLRVIVLNGTKQPGLAGGIADLLRQRHLRVVQVGNTTARRDYEASVIIDVTQKRPEETQRIAELLGATATSLPEGEVLQKETDIVVIIGAPSNPPGT